MAGKKAEIDLKSEVAQHKLRDAEGHFVHADPPSPTKASVKEGQNPLSKFLSDHTHYSKSQDDLLDIHVGDPLKKITGILLDIKKQKAFSFSLKGSLGAMGVVLTLSVFGIFGGGKILCDRGVQSQIGVVKVLSAKETNSSTIPFIGSFVDLITTTLLPAPIPSNRVVLIKKDDTVINLLNLPNIPHSPNLPFINQTVVVTGNFDACSMTQKVDNPEDVEVYR